MKASCHFKTSEAHPLHPNSVSSLSLYTDMFPLVLLVLVAWDDLARACSFRLLHTADVHALLTMRQDEDLREAPAP